MLDATRSSRRLRLAVASGVPPSQLSTALALQRIEEPDTTLEFFKTAGNDLHEGLLEGRYDAGLSLQVSSDPTLKTQPLWTERLAIALPSQCPLLNLVELDIGDFQDQAVYRWQAEVCASMDERLSSLMPVGQGSLHQVTSFEMMALWVAAGYGVGLSTQSRIMRARHGWGLTMRPLVGGPYEIVTYLQRLRAETDSVSERFERRALRVAKTNFA